MLPARNLFEYQQAVLVARVEKMWRLRIVWGADHVALEFFAQNPRIAFLHPGRHCLADKRKRLVTVQAAQFQMFAVQIKAAGCELRFAKADARLVMIEHSAAVGKRDADVVESRSLCVPEFDVTEIRQDNFRRSIASGRQVLRVWSDNSLAIAKFGSEFESTGRDTFEIDPDIYAPVVL